MPPGRSIVEDGRAALDPAGERQRVIDQRSAEQPAIINSLAEQRNMKGRCRPNMSHAQKKKAESESVRLQRGMLPGEQAPPTPDPANELRTSAAQHPQHHAAARSAYLRGEILRAEVRIPRRPVVNSLYLARMMTKLTTLVLLTSHAADARPCTEKECNGYNIPERTINTGSGIEAVAWARDGSDVTTGDGVTTTGVVTVRSWDVLTGACTQTLTGHTDEVRSVAYAPDGKHLASGSDDKTIKIWDTATGACTQNLTGHTFLVLSVAYAPDGKHLASGSADKTIKIWDTATGACTQKLTGHTNWVNSVAYAPDGKHLASGGDKTIKIWDTATGACTQTLTEHTDFVYSVAYAPDGKHLASGSGDKTIKIWDPATGACTKTLTGHTDWVYSVAYAPDGKHLASGSADHTVKIWDTSTGACTQTLTGHIAWVYSVAYAADGKHLASGSGDTTVKVWSV